MTVQGWLVIVFLVAAATAVAWPVRAGRARRRAVLGSARRNPVPSWSHVAGGPRISGARTTVRGGRWGEPVADRPLPVRPSGRHDATHPAAAPVPVDGRRPRAALSISPASASAAVMLAPGRPAADPLPGEPTGSANTSGAARLATTRVAGRGRPPERIEALVSRHGLLLAILVGGGTGAVLGGPVAAAVLAAYGVLAVRAVRRRRARQLADRARRHELDQLCDLAAGLRAGLPVGGAAVDGPHRIARLTRAAVRLADRTGAPLAELLERVEADARAADRGLAAAAAQAAGSRATAWLLAALPLGGIGLGYAIGVDPVAVLLHTTIGGGSALAAVALQIGGLLWAERLGAAPGRDE
ncbi:type II secretion system F family protein [Micromonospora sp. SL1-18]|uniref:type II secretion system F family protein n=1 Tax=Micromonospora sp. SL1-18 TaxID=3399128 RepID=UPI003A4D8E1C